MERSELNQAERELLSAHADGELAGAEARQAEALLARPEAAEYLRCVQALSGLVQRHGALRAPVGLASRVLVALDSDVDGISRPTNRKQEGGKVHALPTTTWRMPFVAAAAALVISLGIMFGPSLLEPAPERGTGIARELPGLDTAVQARVPEPESSTADKPAKDVYALEALEEDGAKTGDLKKDYGENLGKELAKEGAALRREAEGEDPAASDPANPAPAPGANTDGLAEEVRKVESTGRTGAAGGSEPAPKHGTERERAGGDTGGGGGVARGKKKNETWDDSSNSRNDSEEKVEEGARESKGEDDREAPKKSVAGPTDDKQGLGGVQGEPNQQPQGGDSKDGSDFGRAKGKPQPEPPAQPALGGGTGGAAEEQNEDSNDAGDVTVTLETAMALAAQAEVLRVGALHGKAQLDPDAETESVVIELDESRLPELLGALKRLAGEQELGNLKIPAGVKAEPAAGPGNGYLPESLRPGATKTQAATKPAEEADGEAAENAAPGRTVRLRVRLQ
ncbi:MAG: hypothetical protein IT463_12340 [Planctomycetes bacterium]|nr:hypothetical protein [Planctomycetota bacterium]